MSSFSVSIGNLLLFHFFFVYIAQVFNTLPTYIISNCRPLKCLQAGAYRISQPSWVSICDAQRKANQLFWCTKIKTSQTFSCFIQQFVFISSISDDNILIPPTSPDSAHLVYTDKVQFMQQCNESK